MGIMNSMFLAESLQEYNKKIKLGGRIQDGGGIGRGDHFLFLFLSLYWICYNISSVLCFGSLATRHVGS